MRNKFYLAAVALWFGFLLAGCLGPSLPKSCSSYVKPVLQEKCAYGAAVAGQDPSICYSIANMSLRETCLLDSNNPDAMSALQESQVVNEAPPQVVVPANATAPEVPPAPPAEQTPVDICMVSQKVSKEACMRAIAIQSGNMSLCNSIEAGEYRESCVQNVALTFKRPSDCDVLQRPSDQQLCQSYSSG